MEPFLVLLVLGLVVVVFVLPIAAFVRSGRAAREAEQLSARITALELELARLRTAQEQEPAALKPSAEAVSSRASLPETPPAEQPAAAAPPEVREQPPQTRVPEPRPSGQPPVLPIPTVRPALPRISAERAPVFPPRIPPVPERQPAFHFEKLKGSLNWEQFM